MYPELQSLSREERALRTVCQETRAENKYILYPAHADTYMYTYRFMQSLTSAFWDAGRGMKKVCKEFELLQNENRWMNYSGGNIRLVWLLIWWSQSNDTKRKLRNKPNIRDVKHMAHAEFMLLLILHPLQGPLKSCLATGFLKSCFTWGKRCVLSNLENTAGEATLWEVPGLDWISFHADKNQWRKRNGS